MKWELSSQGVAYYCHLILIKNDEVIRFQCLHNCLLLFIIWVFLFGGWGGVWRENGPQQVHGYISLGIYHKSWQYHPNSLIFHLNSEKLSTSYAFTNICKSQNEIKLWEQNVKFSLNFPEMQLKRLSSGKKSEKISSTTTWEAISNTCKE